MREIDYREPADEVLSENNPESPDELSGNRLDSTSVAEPAIQSIAPPISASRMFVEQEVNANVELIAIHASV